MIDELKIWAVNSAEKTLSKIFKILLLAELTHQSELMTKWNRFKSHNSLILVESQILTLNLQLIETKESNDKKKYKKCEFLILKNVKFKQKFPFLTLSLLIVLLSKKMMKKWSVLNKNHELRLLFTFIWTGNSKCTDYFF